MTKLADERKFSPKLGMGKADKQPHLCCRTKTQELIGLLDIDM